MNDPRMTPANERVAAEHLRSIITGVRYTRGTARQVSVPVADLLRAPRGKRDRQLLMGQIVIVYETRDRWCFVQAERDGYVGYLPANTLTDPTPATHQVIARNTHIYPSDDFKSQERCVISFGSEVAVIEETSRFSRTPQGFIPKAHLAPLGGGGRDPVSFASVFLGTPYLWGGNSGSGLDCSGLIQAACLACNITCPGDSDMQERLLGHEIDENTSLQRNDLLFWKGHVAWVLDAETILHANAHHMAVKSEPLADAVRRIEVAGFGPITSRKRLPGF